MATLWIPGKEKGWSPLPLGEGSVGIGLNGEAPGLVEMGSAAALVIIPWRRPNASGCSYLLVVRQGDRVFANGIPPLGIRVLRDKDEISFGGKMGRIIFSTESVAKVERYLENSGERAQHCPRCKDDLSQGQPVVRCQCGIFYHQQEERPCFTYGACVICGRLTPLDRYSWVPADE